MEKIIEQRFKDIEMRLDDLGNAICESYQQGRKSIIKIVLPRLKLIRKIINEYHSQFPFIEVGRQNALDDIDNEVNLDGLIAELENERKI